MGEFAKTDDWGEFGGFSGHDGTIPASYDAISDAAFGAQRFSRCCMPLCAHHSLERSLVILLSIHWARSMQKQK